MSKDIREMIDKIVNIKQPINENIDKPLYKDIDKPLYKEPETGKEHSLKYENNEPEFAEYLRVNYYNVKLSNEDVSIIKREWVR
jgi:hypothetical protein